MGTRDNTTYTKTQKFSTFEQYLTDEHGERFADYRVQYKKSLNYDQNGYLPEFPITVSFELVNRCNLSCVMCFTISHYDKKSLLTRETLEKVTNEMKEYSVPAAVVGLGAEPLIYKDIDHVLEQIQDAGVMDLYLGTNGVLLQDDFMESLVKNRLSRIEISLDAATPETYQKIRGKDELLKIERNIHKMIELKEKHNSKLPVIRLCFCVQETNQHEVDAFREKWRGKVDYVDFQRKVDFSYVDEVRNGNYENASKITPDMLTDTHCAYPFNSVSVWANGNVTPCCAFYGMGLVLGNVNEQSIKEIWDGEKINEIRQGLLNGTPHPTCAICLYHRDHDSFTQIEETKHEPVSTVSSSTTI